jgi:elongator complex protein 3
MVPLGTRKSGWQHRGWGAKLVEAAEDKSREQGYKTLNITSGIGARGYYRRLGYTLQEPYMIKELYLNPGSDTSLDLGRFMKNA